MDALGAPIQGGGKQYRGQQDPNTGQLRWSPPQSISVSEKIITYPNGETFRIKQDRYGQEIGRERVLDPRMMGTSSTNTSNTPHYIVQPNGDIVEVRGTSTKSTSTQKVLPGGQAVTPPAGPSGTTVNPTSPVTLPTPPGRTKPVTPPAAAVPPIASSAPGRVVGGRPLAPGQRIGFEQKLGAFNNTLDLAQKVQKNLDLVGNLIDAKKIDLQTDPSTGIIKAIINRSMPMNDREMELAGDVASLMEHINTLRGPLAATGFRGHEAWGALQAQRGNLMANPGVTKRTLDNTITALRTQKAAIEKGLSRGDQSILSAPPDTVTPDWKQKAISAQKGEIIDTPSGKVRKDGPNQFTRVP